MKMALTDGSRVTEEGAEQNVHARWPWAGFPSWAEKGGFGPGAQLKSLFPFLFLGFPLPFIFQFPI
jgi:hypothetical protein